MRNRTAPWLTPGRLFLLALAAMPLTVAAVGQEIRIGGTGNALGTMRHLAAAYGKLRPDVKVVVLPSIGSTGAMKAVPKGAIEIGLSSRATTDEEARLGMVAVEYARSPLVFVVSTKSGVHAVTLRQVADIYSGTMATWPDGVQVRPVMRQHGSDEVGLLRKVSPAIEKAIDIAEKRPGLAYASNDQESADQSERTPGAFGVSTLSLVVSENRPLRALTLDGVAPTAANAAAGKYPLSKAFYLVTLSSRAAAVKGFVEFVQSPAGHKILIATGNWVP